ncbi:hypothetical protein [Erythrobacter sp. Alg231-14]|uniref:hypothetical protein n=1 Tax=Erythrobacter sp. Alg231-14 TaxID=1922225 RepID=UPI000D55FE7D
MSFAAAIVLIVQSSAVATAPGAATTSASPSSPIAERVTARANVIRPARINFDIETSTASVTTRANTVQRGRDEAGTVWIEFS